MTEVETHFVLVYQGAFLVNVIAEHLLQRVIKDVATL